ncbi:hypothetical protein EG829_09905, partial [bacterium]|nr:hypothetical protein [bacterium]
IFGFTIGYKPYALDPSLRLCAPYMDRKGGSLRFMRIEDVYDYTKEDTSGLNWYVNPMKTGRQWTEPYFGSASSDLLAVYSVPFSAPGEKGGYTGVVAVVYSLGDVRSIMEGLNLDSKGFGYLVSRKGTFISHPDREYVRQQKNIREILNMKIVSPATIDRIAAGRGEVVEYLNELTGRRSIAVSVTVPSTGYILGSVYDLDLMLKDKACIRRQIIEISLTAVLGIILLCVSAAMFCTNPSSTCLWASSFIISAVLVMEIGLIWFLALRFTPYSRPENVIIYDQASLRGFMATLRGFINSDMKSSACAHEKEFITVPTGVFVQSLDFGNAHDVTVTGYIWQRYGDSVPADVTRSFIMPEAINSTKTEIFRKKDRDVETIGWIFKVTLRQETDYSRYPFDNKVVRLRLRPAVFDRNILLSPDLQSYQLTNPRSLPGVEHSIVLEEGDPRESFFSYVTKRYNTDFGLTSSGTGVSCSPELYYSIIIARKFINPLIVNLLPFLVISSLLFCTLLLVHPRQDNAKGFEIGIVEALAVCSGLFFSVLIAHNGLRSSLAASGFLYLENLYFVMYGAIVYVTFNAFRVASGSRSGLMTSRHDLIIKLLYWPAILSFMLLITAHTFY